MLFIYFKNVKKYMSNYRSSNPYKKLKSLKTVHQNEKFDCFALPTYKVENNH